MAQNLTQRNFPRAVGAQIFVKPSKLPVTNVDQQRPRRPHRAPLPFRAVNLRDTPGYDPGLQRHHLLPRQLLSKRCFGALFDNIGREWPGFDDFRTNGMLLPASNDAALRMGLPLHRGPHRDYNTMVIERVGEVEAYWSNLRWRAPQTAHGDAIARLHMLQRELRQRLLGSGRRRLSLNRFDPLGSLVDFTEIDALVDSLWPNSDPWASQSPTRADQPSVWATTISARASHRASDLVCA